jgi:cytochrome b561
MRPAATQFGDCATMAAHSEEFRYMSATPPLPPEARYSARARRFHWWMFGFVLLAYVLINLVDLFERGTPLRRFMMQSHVLAGLAVLALSLPRLLHRMRNAPPPILPPIAGWEVLLSRLTHGLLYGFLLVQPILGLLTVWYGGRGIFLPGTELQIPSPLAENHDLHEQLEDIHGWVGTIFYYIIGLHIVGALWHHFVRQDSTLRRIL